MLTSLNHTIKYSFYCSCHVHEMGTLSHESLIGSQVKKKNLIQDICLMVKTILQIGS